MTGKENLFRVAVNNLDVGMFWRSLNRSDLKKLSIDDRVDMASVCETVICWGAFFHEDIEKWADESDFGGAIVLDWESFSSPFAAIPTVDKIKFDRLTRNPFCFDGRLYRAPSRVKQACKMLHGLYRSSQIEHVDAFSLQCTPKELYITCRAIRESPIAHGLLSVDIIEAMNQLN